MNECLQQRNPTRRASSNINERKDRPLLLRPTLLCCSDYCSVHEEEGLFRLHHYYVVFDSIVCHPTNNCRWIHQYFPLNQYGDAIDTFRLHSRGPRRRSRWWRCQPQRRSCPCPCRLLKPVSGVIIVGGDLTKLWKCLHITTNGGRPRRETRVEADFLLESQRHPKLSTRSTATITGDTTLNYRPVQRPGVGSDACYASPSARVAVHANRWTSVNMGDTVFTRTILPRDDWPLFSRVI